MSLSRRDFVKLCTGTAAGYGVSRMFHPAVREALAGTLTGELPPVFWLQGQGCTGCSVSILNSMHPAIAEVLLKIISLDFHPTIMAAEGQLAFQSMLDKSKEFTSQYVLIVEGSIPLKSLEEMGVISPDGEIRFGVYRADYYGPQEEQVIWSSWIIPDAANPDFHIPSSLGVLKLR